MSSTATPTGRLQDVIMPPASSSTAPAVAASATTSAHGAATTTIDGVTMSREQAMKLALSDNSNARASYRPLKAAAAIVVALVVGGYIWQVNYPNLALKLASAKAGVSANLPNYIPSGWTVDRHIAAGNGQLQYKLRSDNGQQAVSVTQSKSEWDSQALLENYVLNNANQYTALQAQGLTIYLYGNNQASWINHGNWFRLDGGGSSLNQDQLIKIATSL